MSVLLSLFYIRKATYACTVSLWRIIMYFTRHTYNMYVHSGRIEKQCRNSNFRMYVAFSQTSYDLRATFRLNAVARKNSYHKALVTPMYHHTFCIYLMPSLPKMFTFEGVRNAQVYENENTIIQSLITY